MRLGIIGGGRLGRTLAVIGPARGLDIDLRGRGEGIPDAPVVWLTVPDSAIGEVAATVPHDRVVLHASGARGLDALGARPRAGSLHPLMSFPGPDVAVPDTNGVHAAIAGDEEALAAARAIAEQLGFHAVVVPGDRRLYHAAAVMAGNFATVLLAEAGDVLAAAGVDPTEARRMLLPLALASLRNAAESPARALTGPVARGDETTIAAHVAGLRAAGLDVQASLYEALTERARNLRRKVAPPS